MILLGLDFDNTLVCYDTLFYQIAVEKSLIDESLKADKITIRDYLRSEGKDSDFTLLQGEVYGSRILDAEPAEGMLESLKDIKKRGIEMVIVSHKTLRPFKGPQYNLHEAALSWLKKHHFFSEEGLDLPLGSVYFEETKKKKVEKISSLGCTHFIDDLPEILQMIPGNLNKILYANNQNCSSKYINMNNWSELKELI